MIRLLVAVIAAALLTLAPKAYQLSLTAREPADFPSLRAALDNLRLDPEGWSLTDASFDLDQQWWERLGLHHAWSVDLVSPQGRRIHVLLMLSETGEQLQHSPDVCYAAHGCEVRGDVVRIPLAATGSGEILAVQVVFDQLVDGDERVAAYGYWADSQWKSPPKTSILNELGREPFLLKLQLLVDDAKPNDPKSRQEIDGYLAFLGEQLRELGL